MTLKTPTRTRKKKPQRRKRTSDNTKSKASRGVADAEKSAMRTLLMNAADELMRAEGYGAVTFRKVASKAGIIRQLIYYYFRTLDDLFLALWQRYSNKIFIRQAQALGSRQPLRAMWEYFIQVPDTSLSLEFWALANHRETIKKEIADTGEQFHRLQTRVFARLLDNYGLGKIIDSPDLLTFIMSALSRCLISENRLGVSRGHAELHAFVERWLNQIEGPSLSRK